MFDYERTELWKRTLGERSGDAAQAARAHLREQLRQAWQRAVSSPSRSDGAYPA